MITDMYNSMLKSLLPVEAPLVQSHIDKIDALLVDGTLVVMGSEFLDKNSLTPAFSDRNSNHELEIHGYR